MHKAPTFVMSRSGDW